MCTDRAYNMARGGKNLGAAEDQSDYRRVGQGPAGSGFWTERSMQTVKDRELQQYYCKECQ